MQLVVARLIVLSLYYFAAGGRGTRTKTNKKNQTQLLTWFIDGDNLWGSRSVPKEKTTIKEKLLDLRGSDGVYLVFDGKGRGLTENHVEATDMLQVISLAEGVTADDFIYEEIKGMLSSARDAKVQVVTADRELRRRVRFRTQFSLRFSF